ncbi:hypothetical protein D3C77_675100 [compost metagenome]
MHFHTDALDEFLGERTVEEVALGLLADVVRLELIARISCNFDGYRAVLDERDQLKTENEKMRSLLAEVSRTSGDKWAVMAARNLLKEFAGD